MEANTIDLIVLEDSESEDDQKIEDLSEKNNIKIINDFTTSASVIGFFFIIFK